MDTRERLGTVVSGSLSDGLVVRLDGQVSVEDVAVGRYVVIEGERMRFFGMITDVRLGLLNEQFRLTPPPMSDPFIAQVVRGTGTFGLIEVAPMLTLPLGTEATLEPTPRPVKTIPTHFAPVFPAGPDEVAAVFGQENEERFFIGTPIDMEQVPICLNLPRLVERSSGIFGKSGTGKTFLTRLLLIGIVQRNAAVSLVFDMHNEYGWEGSFEDPRYGKVRGLKRLFPAKVAIFTLDPKSSNRRKVAVDFAVQIPYDQVMAEDIEMLRETLDLSQAMVDGVYRLAERLGPAWLPTFLEGDTENQVEWANAFGLHSGSLQALHRKLSRLRRLEFLRPEVADDSVRRILECLRQGIHVVLEFGRYSDLTTYVLVANLLTRRIHDHYVQAMEKALGEQGVQPLPLLITIEEAHKFLNPRVAAQTTFGTIAREMRKYNVTLLVVDQRPSSIDDEVMSQVGTRITYLLDDEKDIAAILTGVSGAGRLRSVLARLDSRKQALLLGHAVPMPVVIETREYGTPESYAALGAFLEGAEIAQAGAEQDLLRSADEEEDWL